MPSTHLNGPPAALRLTRPLAPHRPRRAEKFALLGRGASPRATLERLDEFRRLFALRYSGGIVTREGQGPRAWTAFRRRLGKSQIIQHLLGDRTPALPPAWYGARSFKHSR
jgi:hypothetical protein